MTEPEFSTLEFTRSDHIATVTLNRPHVLNSFNQQMLDEFSALWTRIRLDDEVRVVVLQANGDRAFSSGMDRRTGIAMPENPWSRVPPAFSLGPKTCHVFKPLITAVHGICAGGAFYWLAESDIIICSEDAQFFDPHTSAGLTSPFVAPALVRQIPPRESLRMALLSSDERISAARALQVGLVSEVVANEELRARARYLAERIAVKEPAAIQGTVKAAWMSQSMSPAAVLETGVHYSAIGNPLSSSTPLGRAPAFEVR